MTLVKTCEEDFIQGGAGYLFRYRDHCNDILQGQETGLNSKYWMGKWELIAKEQGSQPKSVDGKSVRGKNRDEVGSG